MSHRVWAESCANAIPGNEELRYSQALVGVDGKWRGIEVWALPHENVVIEDEIMPMKSV